MMTLPGFFLCYDTLKSRGVDMSKTDQEKWDRKYLDNPRLREKRPPIRWIERYATAGEGKEALDLACGTGRNAIALAEKGWRVEAVDLSPMALQILTEHAQEAGVLDRLETECIDLDTFAPEERSYDLILMANYLDRELITRLIPALEPDGLFIVETYMEHPGNEKKDANPNYLLKAGELLQIFAEGFETVAYDEFWNEGCEIHRMRKAAIVARKTGDKR
jgi:2-polyprenyl-3-methyl-5-hydroxy-6-metoxy-1,4-benzoquinol methylase